MKRITATGEMSARDLEKGGEWYGARETLEALCKKAGVPCKVKPFDVYQGPYADVGRGVQVWFGEGDDNFTILDESKKGDEKLVFEGTFDEAAQRLKTLKGKHLQLVKSKVQAKYKIVVRG